MIYRVPEPVVPRAAAGRVPPRGTARATALRVRYPDGPHDAESLLVTPAGDLLILTKGGKAIRVYRVPASAWGARGMVIAESLGTVPIIPETASLRLVTDAALAPDGVRVAVRTYREIFFLRLTGRRLEPDDPPRACDTFGIQLQGEGVAGSTGAHPRTHQRGRLHSARLRSRHQLSGHRPGHSNEGSHDPFVCSSAAAEHRRCADTVASALGSGHRGPGARPGDTRGPGRRPQP